MFIEPTITWVPSVPSGFSGYIWLDTKTVLKKMYHIFISREILDIIRVSEWGVGL